jgi:hypothetical protein
VTKPLSKDYQSGWNDCRAISIALLDALIEEAKDPIVKKTLILARRAFDNPTPKYTR